MQGALAMRRILCRCSRQASSSCLLLLLDGCALHIRVFEHEELDFVWKWTASGIYTAQSAYLIQFEGCARSGFADFVWKTDAPGKCKLFAWLALLGRCNTADVLARKGWPAQPSMLLV